MGGRPLTLLQPDGHAMALDPIAWKQALELARAHGWKPAGTLPPPLPWTGPVSSWHGQYDPPAGQEVTRADARAFATALQQAAASRPLPESISSLARFALQAGFLLIAAPEALDSLISLAHHVGLRQPAQHAQPAQTDTLKPLNHRSHPTD